MMENQPNGFGLEPERLWVRAHIADYCAPDEHDFSGRDVHTGVRWCMRCFKEEPADGHGCMVCDAEGTRRVRLCHDNGRHREVWGLVCEMCFAALRDSGVAGWNAAPRLALASSGPGRARGQSAAS